MSTITNLKGTSWVLPEDFPLSDIPPFFVNFLSNGVKFTSMNFNKTDLRYGSTVVYSLSDELQLNNSFTPESFESGILNLK